MADRALRFDLLGRDKTFGRTLGQAEGKMRRFSSGFTKLAAVAGGAFAGIAITAGIKSTIDAASDLNESISKARVVFGKSSKAVEVFAKTAAKNLGQSRQQALEATSTFGNLFVSMKLGQRPAADMSVKITRLASDLASFNNVPVAEALEALRSGLVGETEPLRRFGINLNDADLRQRALALGLTKSTKNVLPPAIKAQAAYSLIMEQSATAQGDFARTSQGAANQQRIFAARIQDLKANIGKGLLPVFSAAVKFLNEQLIPAISRFATRVREKVGPAIAGLTGGLQERFDRFKLDAKIFGRNLALRIKGTAQAVIVAFQAGLKSGDWGQLGEILGNILKQAIGNGVDLIKRAFGGVDWFKVGKEATFIAVPFAFGFLDSILDALVKQFKEHPWESTFAVLALIPGGRAAGALSKSLGKLPLLGPLLRALERAGKLVERPVGAVVGAIVRFFGAAIERAFPTIGKRIGEWAVRWIVGISSRYNAMRKAGGRFIRGLVDGILDQAGLVIRNVAQVIGWLTRPFSNAIRWLFAAGRNVLRGLWRGLISIWDDIKRWFLGIPNWIRQNKGPLALDAALLVPAGRAIMGGFLRGLRSGGGAAMDYVSGIVGDIFGMVAGIGQGGTSGNVQKLAQRMAAGMGWTGAQWNALRSLVQNESGWNPNAQNPTSSAYGLFQFLDSTWGSVGATKTSSPVGQIAAGLRYIKSRYGSPLAAWSAWLSRSPHWYGKGVEGIFAKPTLIGVGERGPEAVSVTPLGRNRRSGTTVVALHFHGPVVGGQRGAEELAALVQTELLKRKRAQGGIALGLS